MSGPLELKPTLKLRVIDLVKAAGVDVSDWSNFKGGRQRAQVNPKYCYEWSFVQPRKVVVLNLWHGDMRRRNGTIVLDLNMLKNALNLARAGGKAVWTKRAERMDEAIRAAFVDGLPVRAVVVDGTRRQWSDPDARPSSVARRKLDPVPWAVTSYDPTTGQTRLTRGALPSRPAVASAFLSKIRTVLLQLTNAVSIALNVDSRSRGVPLVPPRQLRPTNDQTGGHWAVLGRLTPGVSMELWLDHFSGLLRPRAWVGFASSSWYQLSSLLTLPPLANMRRSLLRRTARDVTGGPFLHFKHSLRSDEFDVLVHEDYGNRHYLGVYYPYSWPFSPRDRQALVREAANFLASVYAGVGTRSSSHSRSRGTPGPWNRPDPRTESAAIRHISRHLGNEGYSVTSREREICGYDLHATRGTQELHIEVKGCKNARPRFFVSRTELNTAKVDDSWRLAVVTNALRRPAPPRFLTQAQMQRLFDLEPTQWEGTLKTRGR